MRTGQGCRVDVNLMQAALDLQAESLTAWLNAPQRPTAVSAPEHVAGWYYPAPYGVYATRDGHLAISLVSFETLAEALSEPRLAGFSEQDGWSRRSEIAAIVARALQERTTAEWVARMQSLKIWHAPVQEYDELLEDPQVQYNRCFLTVPGAGKEQAPITLVNHPLQYDGESAEIRIPPQPLGAQTAEILAELGYAAKEIDSLQEEGIVRQAGASAARAERAAGME
jgi:crotonobetainyl-CoA:carnitine CoA-transferase CaiB-like acyl-CoA transferase